MLLGLAGGRWLIASAPEIPFRKFLIAAAALIGGGLLLHARGLLRRGREDIGRISELIRTVAQSRTVLMVEHNLSVVADLSHRITVLMRGRVLAEGDYRAIADNAEVREAYLGSGHA